MRLREPGVDDVHGGRVLPATLIGVIAAAALVSPAETGVAEADRPALTIEPTPSLIQAETKTPMSFHDYVVASGKIATKSAANSKQKVVTRQPNQGPCTSIRRGDNELYLGKACRGNAKAAVVGSGYRSHDWVYSAVLINGIYKCGFIRDGIVKNVPIRQDVMNYCAANFTSLIQKRFFAYSEINCPQIIGIEGCRGGAPVSKLVLKRCPRTELTTNFATREPSIFNVLGTGEGGFSGVIADHKDRPINWRATTRLGSKDGRAAMVQGPFGWGFLPYRCTSKKIKKNIGPITNFSPEQLERIKHSKSDLRKFRKLTRERARYIRERGIPIND